MFTMYVYVKLIVIEHYVRHVYNVCLCEVNCYRALWIVTIELVEKNRSLMRNKCPLTFLLYIVKFSHDDDLLRCNLANCKIRYSF
jgi:hypothetical protein